MVFTVLLALLLSGQLAARPSFEDYAVTDGVRGAPATPNLDSHPEARRYRTVLERAAAKGPDFAGYYAFVRIGCGTSCVWVALVDCRDGSVFFPQGLRMVQWAGWTTEPYGPEYRRTSRLVVVYGQANTEDAPHGISYFVWTGHDFELIKFDKREPGSSSAWLAAQQAAAADGRRGHLSGRG